MTAPDLTAARVLITAILGMLVFTVVGVASTTDATQAQEPESCLQGDFVEDGVIHSSDMPDTDSVSIFGMRWATHEGCERFVVDFANDAGDQAQQPGSVTVEFLRDAGLIRAHMPTFDIETLDTTEVIPEGDLIAGAYAIWSLDGTQFVDVHLREGVTARAFVLDSPGRLVIDVQPGGSGLPPQAPAADNVVVTTPRPGADVTYPLTVRGYARTFESNVLARVTDSATGLTLERHTAAAAWLETWGEFVLRLNDGPAGAVELFVGVP